MYKIDRRGGAGEGVQKSFTRTDPSFRSLNKCSINVELTSTFLLYRGWVHHHHEILGH